MTRTTHTLADLPLSPAAYEEIAAALRDAGYAHAFLEGGRIDMSGIAVCQDRARAPGVAMLAELIRQRSEYIGSYDQVPAGGVWIDRGLRATGNTTRMCRAAVVSAAKGVNCVLVFPNHSHVKEIGERTIDAVLHDFDRGDGVLLIDGEEHPRNKIEARIKIVTLRQHDDNLAGLHAVAVFPDGSVVSEVMRSRFQR